MNICKEVESKITAEQKREWQAKQEARRDNVELQKMRIEAEKTL